MNPQPRGFSKKEEAGLWDCTGRAPWRLALRAHMIPLILLLQLWKALH